MPDEPSAVEDSGEPSDDESGGLLHRLAETPPGITDAAAAFERLRRFAPGAVIANRYRLERQLGEGGMGIVWAAAHTVTGKRVALKFLKTPWGQEGAARRRFLREARAASAVRHPNVVEIVDVFDLEDGAPVIVMDLLEGENLRQRLAREQRLDLETTATLLLPIAEAIAAAHRIGIVHRDLKPDNIFLVGGGPGEPHVKVLDFGVAKLLHVASTETETAATTTGALIGTPAYMPLEQAIGQVDPDQRVDVWALGAVFYECLAGERAVKGSNVGQAVLQLTREGIRPLGELVPALPRDVTECVDSMLAADRSARPSDLTDAIRVLKRYARSRSDGYEPDSSPPAPHPRSPPPVLGRRRRWIIAASMGLVATAAYYLVVRQREPPRRVPVATVNQPTVSMSGALTAPTGFVRIAEQVAPDTTAAAPSPAASANRHSRVPRTATPGSASVAAMRERRAPVEQARTHSAFDGGLVERVPF